MVATTSPMTRASCIVAYVFGSLTAMVSTPTTTASTGQSFMPEVFGRAAADDEHGRRRRRRPYPPHELPQESCGSIGAR
jgi:hypothetical protein